jgi:hypothetical protein
MTVDEGGKRMVVFVADDEVYLMDPQTSEVWRAGGSSGVVSVRMSLRWLPS